MSEELILALKAIEDCPVRGHIKMLDDTRLVFVGEESCSDDKLLGFRNANGEDTKVRLSQEAYEALKYLITEPFKGKRVGFPYKLQWQVQLREVEENQ